MRLIVDRLDDGAFATKLIQSIVKSPEIFRPVKPRYRQLRDVEPKHTDIMFVEIDGCEVRIEADVDECASENGRGQFQIGHTKIFHHNQRNKRVEITTTTVAEER